MSLPYIVNANPIPILLADAHIVILIGTASSEFGHTHTSHIYVLMDGLSLRVEIGV